MPALRKRLTARERDLDAWLAEVDGMLLSELDGYLAGLLVCPDLLLPSDWLPVIWARHPDVEAGDGGEAAAEPPTGEAVVTPDAAFAFESDEEAQEVIGLIMSRYNTIAADLRRGRYAPGFDVDEATGEVNWEVWIEGFQQALALRPEAWDAALQGEDAILEAIGGLITLAQVARDESDLEAEEINTLTDAAPDLIVTWVEALHAWRVNQRPDAGVPGAPVAAPKVGRNDPCPCGSGKKFKKCCGAA